MFLPKNLYFLSIGARFFVGILKAIKDRDLIKKNEYHHSYTFAITHIGNWRQLVFAVYLNFSNYGT